LQGTLHEYQGSPDIWFNFGTDAARVLVSSVEIEAFVEGERQCPQSVELLSAQLQCYYSASHYDTEKAAEIYDKLQKMHISLTGRYWRYWVYSATYCAIILGDRQGGIRLLDQGLLYVQRDELGKILRQYRRILLDAPPPTQLVDGETISAEEVYKDHRTSIDTVIQKYKRALELGVEDGYEIAMQMAKLLQEQVYANSKGQDSRGILQQALEMLDYSEQMFTDSPNFTLAALYTQKTNVLMGLEDYSQALELLISLRDAGITLSVTQQLQLQRAAQGSGKSLKLSDAAIVQYILDDNGQALALQVQQNEKLGVALKAVLAFSAVKEFGASEILNKAFEFLAKDPNVFVQIAQSNPSIAELVKYVYGHIE